MNKILALVLSKQKNLHDTKQRQRQEVCLSFAKVNIHSKINNTNKSFTIENTESQISDAPTPLTCAFKKPTERWRLSDFRRRQDKNIRATSCQLSEFAS